MENDIYGPFVIVGCRYSWVPMGTHKYSRELDP